jgi:rubrerythrin
MDHIESNYSPAPSASGDDATPSKRKVSTSKRARLTRDSRARVIAQLMRWRARIPGWDVDALRTLTSTEADGVAMVSAVLPAIGDERLRKLVQQHLADEQRHVDAFGERLANVESERGIDPVAVHPAETIGSLNVIEFMAYLELGELRAYQCLENYRDLFEGDVKTCEVIDSVMRDEQFHCAYSHDQLERWATEGFEDEIEAARKWADDIDTSAFRNQCLSFVSMLPRIIFRRSANGTS